jgi:predicted lysophospholipase L1 biosynthesis ABC-type transport system permease subunit
MRLRPALLVFAAAAVLALASSAIPGKAAVNYPDIDGCTTGCTVAAAGWPFPYLTDYPGLSPAGSASLMGAVNGGDHVLWTALVATWLAWAALLGAVARISRRRRKTLHKRRRH